LPLLFGRRTQEAVEPETASERTGTQKQVPAGTACVGLARALGRVLREPKPEILNLGPLCGESVVYLAGRGARVTVEDFEPPSPIPPRQPGEIPVVPAPVVLDHSDGKFHLILAWELLDFVPPERLLEFGRELRRVTRDGGWLLLLSQAAMPSPREEPLSRYRLLADDLLVRETCEQLPRRRWVHPTREIERALAGFSIQGIHLQRNQMREIVAFKAGVGA